MQTLVNVTVFLLYIYMFIYNCLLLFYMDNFLLTSSKWAVIKDDFDLDIGLMNTETAKEIKMIHRENKEQRKMLLCIIFFFCHTLMV